MKYIVEDIKKLRASLGKKISDAHKGYYDQKIEYPKIDALPILKEKNVLNVYPEGYIPMPHGNAVIKDGKISNVISKNSSWYDDYHNSPAIKNKQILKKYKKMGGVDDYKVNKIYPSIISPGVQLDEYNASESVSHYKPIDTMTIRTTVEEIQTILGKSEWLGPKDVKLIKEDLDVILNSL
jgi:hypothetical protein